MDGVVVLMIIYPALVCGILGLCVGSFLNVVIYRLPLMLRREEQHQFIDKSTRYTLISPRSACPNCDGALQWKDNVPLLSWLLLRGKCRYCRRPISRRYPLVELGTSLVSVVSALLFPATAMLAGVLILSGCLIALAMIDIDTLLLPDCLTLPLLWLGLLFNVYAVYVPLEQAVLGAVAGYLIFWFLRWGSILLTHREGLGLGDAKLLAAMGAWLGWQVLPWLLLVASAFGLMTMFIHRSVMSDEVTREKSIRLPSLPFPFGPSLAMACWGITVYRYGVGLN